VASALERIDLRGVNEIISFDDLITNHLSENADGDAVITVGDNSITLLGVAQSELTENEFTSIDRRLNINGTSGDDEIIGELLSDTLSGTVGDDTLIGNDGNDNLFGGLGQDLLIGGNGSDRLIANDGNDRLVGNSGNDVLNGGAGDDTLTGEC